MTERLYHSDSYLTEFEARIVRADSEPSAVVLDRTAFYPGGGGQPCDLGILAGLKVTRVQQTSGEILHFLEGQPPDPGASVRGSIDWERRYNLMRTHTAMHVLCGVVFRDYGALVTGGEMEMLKGRMDFEFPRLQHELVADIEKSVNEEILAAREVMVRVLPRDEAFKIPDLIRTKINLLPPTTQDVRTVEIAGLDLQADGGTHVHNTREVGSLRVVNYKSKGAINKRLYVEVGGPLP